MPAFASFCFCAPVAAKSLAVLLEVPAGGEYRDAHPWLVAQEMLAAARGEDRTVVLLLATDDGFSHWAPVIDIDVLRYQGGGAESRIRFGRLSPVGPIWQPLDALVLLPSVERLRRERLEGLRPSREALSGRTLHPYAICEAPAFLQGAAMAAGQGTVAG
jgi:hypothetical protein